MKYCISVALALIRLDTPGLRTLDRNIAASEETLYYELVIVTYPL